MRQLVKVDAPAKVNLAFDIVGRREDGYHLIDTIFQSVSLYDTITISRMSGQGVFVSCDRPEIPGGEENLAHKAARRFFERVGKPDFALSIDLQKRIPSQAGMGGGSADAAAVLVGLNVLLEAGVSKEGLLSMAASIGADVPFFLEGGVQRAQGIGERLSKLPDLPQHWLVIAKPERGISTPESFKRYDQENQGQHPNIERLIEKLEERKLSDFCQEMYNVLEEVCPLKEVSQIREKMERDGGAIGSLMTGSGSAVYGIFQDKRLAKRCMRKLYDMAQSVFLVQPTQKGVEVFEVR